MSLHPVTVPSTIAYVEPLECPAVPVKGLERRCSAQGHARAGEFRAIMTMDFGGCGSLVFGCSWGWIKFGCEGFARRWTDGGFWEELAGKAGWSVRMGVNGNFCSEL